MHFVHYNGWDMETANKQEIARPVAAFGGAVFAAVGAGLGLTAAALCCRWAVGGNGRDWWRVAFIYMNQAMVVVWLLVLPALVGNRRAGAAVKSGASPVGLAGAVWLAAAAAAIPAYIWSAWMSHVAWVNVWAMLLAQGELGLFSMAAGVWLRRVSAAAHIYVMGFLGALTIGGPMLIYLQAEFLPDAARGWRWIVPAFQIVRAASEISSLNLFWGLAVYGLCGLVGVAAAMALGTGVKRAAESQA